MAALTLAGCVTQTSEPTASIAPPPAALHLDPFYQKYVDAGGIPVTTSARVPDAALFAARDIVDVMLANRPDLRRELIREGERVGVMAPDEMTTDLPEQRDWKKPTLDDARVTFCERQGYLAIAKMSDRDYWNTRARGMGGVYTTGAAENLLGFPYTVYYGENVLVHEFSHAIFRAAQTADPRLYKEVQAAFDNAKAKGLWKGSYTMQDLQEYWAEGAQFWFNSNMAYKRGPLVVVSDADLKAYDPKLYAALAKVFPASHRIAADVFYGHPARMNSRPVPEDGSEVC